MSFIPNPSSGYISLPVTVDPNQLTANALADIAAQLPGWVPREGHLEVLVIEEVAQMVAEAAAVASQMPIQAFLYFGTLVGITPLTGAAATASATFTAINNAGYTIPAGTVLAYNLTGSAQILFTVTAAVTIAPGSTTGTGTIVCESVGVFANGLPTASLSMVSTNAAITGVATTTVTSGGIDAETVTAYLNRLSAELQLLAPRPILPTDYAILATQTIGVARALGVDGYNPARSVTDAVTNSSAMVTSATIKATQADVGRAVSGTNIPAATFVGTVANATTITLSSSASANVPVNATGSGSGGTLSFAVMTGQQRTVAVAAVDSLGNALSTTVAADLQTALSAAREATFAVYVMPPTYTSIDVTVTAVCAPGANPTSVQTAVMAALTNFLSSANWAGGNQSPPAWNTSATTVRYLDVANVIHDSAGVDHITALTTNVHGSGAGTADIALSGVAPLTQVGTLTVSIATS